MNDHREIVEALANGINPITGEMLPDESPYNDPTVIRALFSVLQDPPAKKFKRKKPNSKRDVIPKKTTEQKQAENIENGRPRNAGLPWNADLEKELTMLFKAGSSIEDLSNAFERTELSIQKALEKLELIEVTE